LSAPKQILENHSHLITLLPALSKQELSQFQRESGGLVPHEIEELLLYSAGFDHRLLGTVRFTGHEGFEFAEAFPRSIALLPDDCGNFWVMDINPQSGAWGSVFYVSHDPPVVVVQAPELDTFLSQIFGISHSNSKNALNYVRKEAATRIWKDDPWLISLHDAQNLPDPLVSKFAKQLPENFRIADLRSREFGSGFGWGRADPKTDIRRNGYDLLFGVRQALR